MSEPLKPKTMRNVTIELEPEILYDVDGLPNYIAEPRRVSGTLSHHWDEILEDGGRHE